MHNNKQVRYYSLPLKLGEVIRKKALPVCTLEASVASLIHLIVTSHFGEDKYDPEFGNIIWENEFGNIVRNSTAKEEIKQSILKSMARYEPRLSNVRLEIRWSQEESPAPHTKRLSERMDIGITATVKATRRPFVHHEHFYIAPLAYN